MRSFLAALALGAVAAPIGCSAILGDFKLTANGDAGGTASDDASNGSDGPGGSDGPNGMSDGPGGGDSPSDGTMPGADGDAPTHPTDAPSEGATALKLLQCTLNGLQNNAQILTVPAYDGGGGGNNGNPIYQFAIEHLSGSQNAVRLLVSSQGSTGTTQSIYTLNDNSGSVMGTMTFSGQSVQALEKTSSGIEMLVQSFSTGGYTLYSLPDSDPGTSVSGLIAQGTIGSLPNQATSGNNNRNMALTPLSGGGYYALATYATASSQFELASWITGSTTWTPMINDGGAQSQVSFNGAIVQDPTSGNNTSVYGFFAPPGAGGGAPTDIDQYTFNTAVPSQISSRSIFPSGSTDIGATAAVALNPSGGYSLAFVELGGAQLADLRLGNVSEANLDTFHMGDLPSLLFNIQSDAGFFDTTPFGGSSGLAARWMSTSGNGQEFGAIGTGGTGGGGSGTYTGLNFYVGTAGGQWLIEVGGSGNNLLAGHTVYGGAFDLAQDVTALLRKYDVIWAEKDSSGTYSLYFNVLVCSP